MKIEWYSRDTVYIWVGVNMYCLYEEDGKLKMEKLKGT